MPSLKELDRDEIEKCLPEKSDLNKIKERAFKIGHSTKAKKTPALVELEIAFRKCKSVGVFDD